MNTAAFGMLVFRLANEKSVEELWWAMLNTCPNAGEEEITEERLKHLVEELADDLRSAEINPIYRWLKDSQTSEYVIDKLLKAHAKTLMKIRSRPNSEPSESIIQIVVKEHDNKPRFYLEGLDFYELYFRELPASLFAKFESGTKIPQNTKFRVARNGLDHKTGAIEYTSGREAYWRWRYREEFQSKEVDTLCAINCELGDRIIIPTSVHNSVFECADAITQACGSITPFAELRKMTTKKVRSVYDLPQNHTFSL